MEKNTIEIPLITIDDLLHNEMVNYVLHIATETLQEEKEKAKGKYEIRVYLILSKILSCFERINQAYNFINKRPTIKELDKNEEMTVIDYYNYHYDVVIHKLSTIRDLSFKLINVVFNLNLKDRDCDWKHIKKDKRITVPGVLSIQELYYYLILDIESNRNESTHNGSFKIKIFEHIDGVVKLSQYKRLEIVPKDIIDFDPMAKGTYNELLLKMKKKELLDLINKEKSISLFCIHVLTCSMSNIFKSNLSEEYKEKHSNTILLANQRINAYERKNNKIELLIPYLAKVEDWTTSLKEYYEGKNKRVNKEQQ